MWVCGQARRSRSQYHTLGTVTKLWPPFGRTAMAYQFTFEPIAASWPLLVQGASLTLALTAVSATAGLAVGILGAVSREWRLPFLHPIYTVYVECVRNTPFIVQL